LNLRPSGYEPDELPDCSTPHQKGRAFYTNRVGWKAAAPIRPHFAPCACLIGARRREGGSRRMLARRNCGALSPLAGAIQYIVQLRGETTGPRRPSGRRNAGESGGTPSDSSKRAPP
jgi:hypothetical protein